MGKEVWIETAECVGCESCVDLCPEVFQMDKASGKSQVILPTGGPEDCIEEAMETCPSGCIHWKD